jgi:3-phosphoshikimate 1-carboxyvinyltransferase
VRVAGLFASSRQGDVRIVEHLAAFGCRAGFDAQGAFAGGAVMRAADVDLEREPDLAPVVAALAARAALDGRGASTIRGLATLPGKESSRIEVLAAGLRALGLTAVATSDTLRVQPGSSGARAELALDPHADHRMAFAFALFGLCVPGVNVRSPECVAKSWPSFWSDLERAGAAIVAGKSG